jgi:hypothetical protein
MSIGGGRSGHYTRQEKFGAMFDSAQSSGIVLFGAIDGGSFRLIVRVVLVASALVVISGVWRE